MAPAKPVKAEINPWGWVSSTDPEKINSEHILKAYRIHDFKQCEERRRNCKKNPYCCWGLGEKKWVQDAEDEADEDETGFREEGEFAGLQNLGATCYVNSLLQLWFHNPILRPAILRWQPGPNAQLEDYKPLCPIAQLQAMFARMKVSKQSKIDPTEFVSSLQLDTGEQQDAQEFSKLFMEVILKLLTEYDSGDVRNSVITAFRGELQNETECTRCSNKTRREESFTELELGVRKNLSESLDDLLKDEVLSGSDQYFCSICNMKNDAFRRTKLLKLPPVLNLQLMRFVFDRDTYRKKKVITKIQFPEVLDMTPRISVHKSETTAESSIYHLTAVLVHNGQSASSGHYVAQVKDIRTGVWHTFNDESVKENTKSKSQKLVLKEEEVNGSENEKKTQRKGKSGSHTSPGAYMLVYTLDRYINNPGPDPELWPYLENLVKREDEAYEEELKKTKSEKDYDVEQREQRKMEIRVLYPTLDLNDQVSVKKADAQVDDADSGDSDFQPPKKVPRSAVSNGIAKSKTTQKNGYKNSDTQVGRKKMINNTGSQNSKHLKQNSNGDVQNGKSEEAVDIKNIDFISVDWMQQWLDTTNPPQPIQNSMLLCQHGQLFPPLPNTLPCLYRIVPSDFADMVYENYNCDRDSKRLRGWEALCRICVENECRRLKLQQGLDDDYKCFIEVNKKFDKVDRSLERHDSSEGPPCWIYKDTLRSWKRIAKNRIEAQFKGSSFSLEPEKVEDQDELDGPLNSELVCHHDDLHPDETLRKLIPYQSWSIIEKYFPDAILITYGSKQSCLLCLNAKKDESEVRNGNKEIASKQKTKLLDLYHLRNRPHLNVPGTFYIVSQDFMISWKKFIREPIKFEPIKEVDNSGLLCKHGEFQYPLEFVADICPTDVNPESETFTLLHATEWKCLKEDFNVSVNKEITITVMDPQFKDSIKYTPDVCVPCSETCWQEMYKLKFTYTNEPIHVIRRDKETQEDDSDNEEDDLFVKIPPTIITGKRERKQYDPNSFFPKKPSSITKDSAAAGGIRRSNRPRRRRDEKVYKVSCTLTIKELKVMLLKDFHAIPSDQHLFFNDKELTESHQTLQDLEIPIDANIYLEIDTECKSDEDPVPIILENGFKGTLLGSVGRRSVSPASTIDMEPEVRDEIILENGNSLLPPFLE